MKTIMQVALLILAVVFSLGIIGSKDNKERYCFLAVVAVLFVILCTLFYAFIKTILRRGPA